MAAQRPSIFACLTRRVRNVSVPPPALGECRHCGPLTLVAVLVGPDVGPDEVLRYAIAGVFSLARIMLRAGEGKHRRVFGPARGGFSLSASEVRSRSGLKKTRKHDRDHRRHDAPRLSVTSRHTTCCKEIRHGLDFGQHRHPALHGRQHAVRAGVHVCSRVRRGSTHKFRMKTGCGERLSVGFGE
jgi:hypothetical protein